MALTYTEAQSVSDDFYDKVLKQQIYQASPFMVKLLRTVETTIVSLFVIRHWARPTRSIPTSSSCSRKSLRGPRAF
ncbi:hypothetical protein LCGC14_2063280 [marine sediment metagenome]|uniref:Uncharacterized protein n=1 Tax=marine sediment metagenome TaxID=412755 RepID=A0A0F9GZ10_9ZZZZ